MEKRKHDHVDLEKRRGLFFTFGIALALSSTLMAIQHTTVETNRLTASLSPFEDIDTMEDPTLVNIPKRPAAPEIESRQILEQFTISDKRPEAPDINKQELPDLDIGTDWSEFIGDNIDDTTTFENKDWMRVEIMPHLESCIDVLDRGQQEICTNQEIIRLVAKNAHYPIHLKDAGIHGPVYISFVIDRKGGVTEVRVQKRSS